MSHGRVAAGSSSTITTRASTGSHVFKVSGYSHLKLLLGTGEGINSAKFEVAGHSWSIGVYPNGKTEACADGSIALYLMLADKPKQDDVHVKLHFSLLRHGNLTEAPYGGRKTDTPVTIKGSSGFWGYPNFGTESEELTNPEYLKDDTILIRCDVTVLSMPVVQRLLDPHKTLLEEQPEKFTTGGYIPISRDAAPLPSASAVAATASTGRHVLKVSGYSWISHILGNGKGIESATFQEAGHSWRIWYYPNGVRNESAGKISLYLELADQSRKKFHCRFGFSLVPHGELPAGTTAPAGGRTRGGRFVFMDKTKCWGFFKFMEREELEKSAEHLKDDTILIQCDITVLNELVVKRHDLGTLGLLCDCNDHLCENLHVHGSKAAAAAGHGLKKMLLGCFCIGSK